MWSVLKNEYAKIDKKNFAQANMNDLRVQPKLVCGPRPSGSWSPKWSCDQFANNKKEKEKKKCKKKVELVKRKEEKEKVGGQNRVWMNKRWVTIHK